MEQGSNKLECDLVMKGGITSGVIYPRLVSELAKTYTFRSIGGTSAGAIAAGAAAAAQLGVLCGAHPKALEQLNELPDVLGAPVKGASGSMLLNLFQPELPFRRHFGLLTGALNAKSKIRLALLVAWGAARRFLFGSVLGALPGSVLLATSHGIGRALALALTVVGIVVGALVAAIASFSRALPGNIFGMCSGMPGGTGGPPSLTSWLHEYLNELAGKSVEEPLTFGELWAGVLRKPGEASPHTGGGPKAVELATMTTALNLGRPFRMPFESGGFYFLEEEFSRLFPPAVTAWLISHARPSETATALSGPGQTFRALPDSPDLPILLAVRMSLSFPILLSAIPLYTVDWTLKVNAERATRASRVLFSDGGICSNFPIHFFDAPLPSRPTFGADLRDFHPDHPTERVWLPEALKGNQGIKTYVPPMSAEPGLASIVGFLASIVSTMQNWNDQLQLVMPGFRDRIVHICHLESEGGLNLNMLADVITTLGNSGRDAADTLERAFAERTAPNAPNAWDNHRRIRMRTLLSAIDQQARRLHRAIDRTQKPTWRAVVEEDDPPSYKFTSQKQKELALRVLEALDDLGKELEESGTDLSKASPRPEPEWRGMPRV